MVLWLNYQRQFYEIQPDRDEVLLPWSFKGEVYRQYKLNPTVRSCTVELVHRDPCGVETRCARVEVSQVPSIYDL